MDDERFVETSELREQIALVLRLSLTPACLGAAFIPLAAFFPAFDSVIVCEAAGPAAPLHGAIATLARTLRHQPRSLASAVAGAAPEWPLDWPLGEGAMRGVPIHGPDGEALGLFVIATREAGMAPLEQPCVASALALLRSLVKGSGGYHQLLLAYSIEKRRAQRLAALAEMDGLSGLLNHQAFRARCNERLGDGASRHALIMVDVDRMKHVNDVYGHQFGDVYLAEIAAALKRSLPGDAVIGRIGGDEFAALVTLHAEVKDQLEAQMSRCSSDVQRVAARLGKPTLGHISIGTTAQTSPEIPLNVLIEQADAALYASKQSRCRSGEIYDAATHANFSATLIRPRFLRAIRRGELEPYFQPIIDLTTGRRAGYEMLARWNDPPRGLLVPQQFSAVFSAPELAEKLTEALLDKALAAFAGFAEAPGQTLSVNLGMADLVKPEFVFEIQTLLTRHRLRWEQIVVEVTENTMLGATTGPVFQNLTELRRRGARVALDDFGTGYGGLGHLRLWPVDMIKIDRSYVAEMRQGPSQRVIAKSLIEIAQAFNLSLVAEGVEDAPTAEMLLSMGCTFAQGYHFGRPAPERAYRTA